MCAHIVSRRICLSLALAFGFAAWASPSRAGVMAPTFENNLFAAYDGTEVTAADDRVSSWTDQTGSYNATQSTDDYKPYLITSNTGNGLHPVLDFRGTGIFQDYGQHLATDAWTALSQRTIFLVNHRDAEDTNSYLVDGIAKSNRNAIFLSDAGVTDEGIYAGSTGANGPAALFGQWAITTAVFNGDASLLRVGGAQVGPLNPGSHTLTGLTIGGMGPLPNRGYGALNGQIAELLVYNTALDSDQIAEVEAYLTAKYFTIPEPSALILVAMGLAGLLAYAWRKRRYSPQ